MGRHRDTKNALGMREIVSHHHFVDAYAHGLRLHRFMYKKRVDGHAREHVHVQVRVLVPVHLDADAPTQVFAHAHVSLHGQVCVHTHTPCTSVCTCTLTCAFSNPST